MSKPMRVGLEFAEACGLEFAGASDVHGTRGAVFSMGPRAYRYMLWRAWDEGPMMTFIGLNPSTADESDDDPTIRRVVGFARREGCGSVMMVNLFALRATDPKAMLKSPVPQGLFADMALIYAADAAGVIVAGWGTHGAHQGRDEYVQELLGEKDIRCLGVTKDGHPKHPLYLPGNAELKNFRRGQHGE